MHILSLVQKRCSSNRKKLHALHSYPIVLLKGFCYLELLRYSAFDRGRAKSISIRNIFLKGFFDFSKLIFMEQRRFWFARNTIPYNITYTAYNIPYIWRTIPSGIVRHLAYNTSWFVRPTWIVFLRVLFISRTFSLSLFFLVKSNSEKF